MNPNRKLPAVVRKAAERGWSIVPVLPTKKAYFPWKKYQSRAASLAELKRWHAKYPEANWAVVTGQISRIVVLDFDGPEGLETMKRLDLKPSILTPGGGAHAYVRAPESRIRGGVRVNTKLFPGMDVRADGNIAIFAGKRASGMYRSAESPTLYEFDDLSSELRSVLIEQAKRDSVEIPLPEDFDDFVPAETLLRWALAKVADGEGRNVTGFWLACQLRDERCSEKEALTVLHRFADEVETAGTHPYTYSEAYDSVVSAFSRPPRAPLNLFAAVLADGYRRTDLGNAERLVARHGEILRYCHPCNSWLTWQGNRWQRDTTAHAERLAKETVRSMSSFARTVADKAARRALGSWAGQSESAGKIGAMVRLAQSEREVVIGPEELDTDPWLLNVLNGTIDLRTGELRRHRKEDMITKLVPLAYDPSASCPHFESFLHRVVPAQEDRGFLQRAVGYSLTGLTIEQCLFLLYGFGANGKTTFLEAVRSATGEYAQHAPPEALLSRRTGAIPNDIARMMGARFITIVETEEGHRLAEALVKQLTGQDRVTARFLYREWEEFTPTGKLWLATNHKPEVRGTTEAIWRRIKLVPFSITIPPEERDPRLRDKLLAELPGILRWAVEGCLAWQAEGLGASANVLAATEAYRSEQDTLGAFLEERCVIGGTLSAPAADLFDAYVDWCVDANVRHSMTQQQFGRALSERGFTRRRTGKQKIHTWFGIALAKTPASRDASTGTVRYEVSGRARRRGR